MSKQETEIVTFGCRLNAYESEIMKAHVAATGLKDAIIFNTCAVTAEAERQVRQSIRKARRQYPHKKIIVTGCAAQINHKTYLAMEEVDQVIGNHEKLKEESFLPANDQPILLSDIMDIKETADHLITGFDGKTRAFAQVQNGCDHRCTFCTIPYGRGNSRSVPLEQIITQVQSFVQEGYKEVVLTGVDITSYGHDLPGTPTLGQMMHRLLAAVPSLPRLRLSSVDPVEIDADVFRLLETEPRFMPHLHISLQAADDLILKRMKRRHLRQDIIMFCEKARRVRPDVVFGADIIAGFPTETEAHFENTRRIIETCDITYVHAFPYSPRPGTPAARMPQVDRLTVKERAQTLRAEAQKSLDRYLTRQIGTTHYVLVEQEGEGRTEHFASVVFDKAPLPGKIIKVHIIAKEGDKLRGEIV